jgi:hypothetical protein
MTVNSLVQIARFGVPMQVFVANCHVAMGVLAFVNFPGLYIPDASALGVEPFSQARPSCISEAKEQVQPVPFPIPMGEREREE